VVYALRHRSGIARVDSPAQLRNILTLVNLSVGYDGIFNGTWSPAW